MTLSILSDRVKKLNKLSAERAQFSSMEAGSTVHIRFSGVVGMLNYTPSKRE